jgi:HlyD family secretion protein
MTYANLSIPRPERATSNTASLRRHAWTGFLIMVLLVGGLGGWAATTEIAGAVVANGIVVVEGGSKHVQHQEGGIVRKIFVRNDDTVTAGQVLVQLDDTAIRADLDVVLSQLRQAIASQSRLTAESTDAAKMVMPAIVSNWPADPELTKLLASEDDLRQSRKASTTSQAAQLDEQISQKQLQINGLQSQQEANNRQLDLFRTENGNLDTLHSDGLVGVQRVNEMKRSQAQLEGEVGSVTADIASTHASIAELQVQRSQIFKDFQSQVLTDLQTANQSVAELLQKKIAAEDRLSRLDIRAPIGGIVHESAVQTVGGVIAAGDTLMLIVPKDNHLLIDTRVSPLDIDKLHVDQDVAVRMSSLDVRTTPELSAAIKTISPDLTKDPTTGAEYYSVRVDVPDSEQSKLGSGTKLVPGMPAEAFMRTGDRTVWSYLMHPISEELSRTFREN